MQHHLVDTLEANCSGRETAIQWKRQGIQSGEADALDKYMADEKGTPGQEAIKRRNQDAETTYPERL